MKHARPKTLATAARRGPGSPEWAMWPDERLLDMRMCDLGLRIEGTRLHERIRALYANLEARGLSFKPHVWLSDEWFSPDGVPGIAIPFYLAHPRLMRLERSQMLEVEGGTPEWCLQILRHEAGHAIENAYNLRKRPGRIQLFGDTDVPYPDHYVPRPYSRKFVVHLEAWYAQAHPDEDFAETFAVWLDPDTDWKRDYEGWPARRKLAYVDRLMRELREKRPKVRTKRTVLPVSSLRRTLREHYEARRTHHGIEHPSSNDATLQRFFSAARRPGATTIKAEQLVRDLGVEARRTVGRWTGARQYVIEAIIEAMAARCRHLGLRTALTVEQARHDFTALLAVATMKHLHGGRHRVAL